MQSIDQHKHSWLHPDYRKAMRDMAAFLLLLAAIQLLIWLLPTWSYFKDIPYYVPLNVPLHVLLEITSIIISMMVFAVGWNSHSHKLSGNIVLLACVFFAVGILDFLHTLSYIGMPDFISPNDAQKQLIFWLSARLLAALVLLVVAIRPWKPLAAHLTRYLIFSSLLGVTLLLTWTVIYHQAWFPDTFIPGQGLTTFKKGVEYLIIFINVITALMLLVMMRKRQTFKIVLLFGAVCTMAMSEFFFTIYTAMSGSYSVLGHIYKVIAFLLIYRATVVEAIEEPYDLLKQSEEALRNSRQHADRLVSNIPVGVYLCHATKSGGFNFDYVSTRFCALLNVKPEDVYRDPEIPFANIHPENLEEFVQLNKLSIQANNPFEWEGRTLIDGHVGWLRIESKPELQEYGGYLWDGLVTDISKRKQAEISLARSNRALAALSSVNHSLVHSADEPELLSAVCQSIVSQSGYRMAWVGYLDQIETKLIRSVATAGFVEGFLEAVEFAWRDAEADHTPCGKTVRSGQIQVVPDIQHDDLKLLWSEQASKRGYASSISLPLANKGKVFGVLTIYSGYIDAFGDEEVRLLEQMAGDLAFGILGLRTRNERDEAQNKIKEQLSQLENNLEDTIKAITTIVEMRDPYTAGHEHRVAELAVAIAKEIGLTDEQVHGIHLAGEVHDLGKIQIPAEILSMPRRLTETEYSLIKIHPQAGYDILKDIDFPWPIAQMVLQHHERIDGSGYPQGLKGEAILLEARILCVADVVEAMSSHRPYRPGLGIDTALNEIRKGRDVIYDPVVVDACLKLFGEGRFKF